ncbi:MAG TPA: 2-phospho-L-lactate transferase [Rhizomicrobium sp.]|nr:2-phospho-L-lactate transferase [Rhizomicrobium sp.]
MERAQRFRAIGREFYLSGVRVLALSGGVGGAKLLRGLYRILPADSLAAVVNTGDDFEHLGLHISPDIDTTLYTLAGLAHPEQGWGRRDETWTFMRALKELGGETWFALGDGDLALHVERTRRLELGQKLSAIVEDFARSFSIQAQIVPMSDDRVATRVATDEGELSFQDYFVRRHCEPAVRGLRFEGAGEARLPERAREAFASPNLEAIVIAPSNPWLSIDPLLAIPELRDALLSAKCPVIAVTPIIGGKAVKGPTAKIMTELGIATSALSIAEHYRGLIDGFVLDARDRELVDRFDVPIESTDTLMDAPEDCERVTHATLALARRIAPLGGAGQGIGAAIECVGACKRKTDYGNRSRKLP